METRYLLIFLIISCTLFNKSWSLIRVKRIVGGNAAAAPPEDDPVVFVNKNDRFARIYGSRDPGRGFYVYKGIRFGEPPVGRSRFQRPRAAPLEGEYNATEWAPPCPQLHEGKVIGSEDCLFLNVFTPALPDSGDGYPVLIWIHGGGFRIGAACQYEMRNLVKKRMVVVSIQYRLGSLGFLSTGNMDLPGNNGMFDMTLAVTWVKKYIEFFGGNPNRIIAFGHGTGASSALMLSLSQITKDYFSGLIAMSGSLLSHFVFDKKPMETTRYIATAHGCPTENVGEMLNCLQELPMEKIISIDSKLSNVQMLTDGFISEISALLGSGPVVEGNDDGRALPNFMTGKPESFLSLGNFPNIPLLTGVVKNEAGDSILSGYKEEVEGKLRSIPDFLNKQLIPSLQSVIPFFGNNSKQLIPEAFRKYLNIPRNGNIQGALMKVSEAVNDAVFNVPAYLTVDYWSKKADAYFYSFDYQSKKSYGKGFLSGLPIVDARQSASGQTGHGDDLGFVFDHNDIFGRKMPIDTVSQRSTEDEKVMDVFTDLISQFVRTGKIAGQNGASMPSFSGKDNSYISITDKVIPMQNYKFCEMSLWTGAVQKLMSPGCDLLRVTGETVQRLGQDTKNVVDLVSSPLNVVKTPVGNVRNAILPNVNPTNSFSKKIRKLGFFR